MVATVIWSQESLDDIDAIAEYISRDSPYHAQRVVEAVFDLGERIGEQRNPLSGRGQDDADQTSRHTRSCRG